MRIIETAYGLFIKRRGKIYEYVGNAWMEIPILSARQINKLQTKAEKIDEETK